MCIRDSVVLTDVSRVVAGNKVCFVDQVGGFDRMIAETQMRAGQTAGLLGVVVKVSLNVFVGMVTDDLNGVFVRANGTVGAQTPEFAGGSAFCLGVGSFFPFQRQAGHIVVDGQGKALFRAGLGVFVNGENVSRNGILRAQAVTTGVDRQRRCV